MIPLLVERGAKLEARREYHKHELQISDECLHITPLWEACLRNDFAFPASGASRMAETLI